MSVGHPSSNIELCCSRTLCCSPTFYKLFTTNKMSSMGWVILIFRLIFHVIPKIGYKAFSKH